MDAVKEFFLSVGSFFRNAPEFEYLLRVLLAALCGGCIGIERAKRQKEAGLRTHVIVALASALAGIVSKYGYNDVLMVWGENAADLSRVASNVLTGIGFLGAGIIFVKGGSVKGLTTAAGVWATCIVGLCIGHGLYIVGVGTALVLIIIQIVLHKYIPGDMLMQGNVVIKVNVEDKARIDEVKKAIAELDIVVTKIDLSRNGDTLRTELTVRIPNDEAADKLLELASQYHEITSVSA